MNTTDSNTNCYSKFKVFPTLVFLLFSAAGAAATPRYVWLDSPSPDPPYTSWATAAHEIQEALGYASDGDEIVVTNGVYDTGGRAAGSNNLWNRVLVDIPVTVRSVNGPEWTVIEGRDFVRCVFLCSNALLSGFTLTNGATQFTPASSEDAEDCTGGGAWCESTTAVISNCVIIGNRARSGGGVAFGTLKSCTVSSNLAAMGAGTLASILIDCTINGNRAGPPLTSSGLGGGVATSRLTNCVVMNNSASSTGGGANSCTLVNCRLTGNRAAGAGGAFNTDLYSCTITGNSATNRGGGVYDCAAWNCIIYFNAAPEAANYYRSPVQAPLLNYCCTEPQPTNGFGNITDAPGFVDYGGGDLRLQPDSPCINAGLNNCVSGSMDLDGSPRIVSGTVDMGAYEFQGSGSVISYAWLQQFSLPTDGTADFLDLDADGHTTWQEWGCLTDPTNALSVLRLVSASPAGADVMVVWQSVTGLTYSLEQSTNLHSAFTLVSTNILGHAGSTTYTDTNAASLSPRFYRVGVKSQ